MQLIFHMDCPVEGQVDGFPSLSHIVFWDERVYIQKHHYGTTFSIWTIIYHNKYIYDRTPVSLSVSGSLNVATCFTFIICFLLNGFFISNINTINIYTHFSPEPFFATGSMYLTFLSLHSIADLCLDAVVIYALVIRIHTLHCLLMSPSHVGW